MIRLKLRKTQHEVVNDRLSAYLDGELSGQERARVKEHLRACQECRHDLRTLRWTRDLLHQTPAVKAPRSFVIRQADISARQPARARRSAFAMRWATAVVTMLFILVLAGDILTGRSLVGSMRAPAIEMAAPEAAIITVTVQVEKEVVVEKSQPVEQPSEEEGRAELAPTTTPSGLREETKTFKAETEQITATTAVTPTPAAAAQATDRDQADAPPTASPKGMGESKEKAPEGTWSADEGPPAASPQPSAEALRATGEHRPLAQEGQRMSLLRAPRIGWRVTEIVLGVALLALVVAILWTRHRA